MNICKVGICESRVHCEEIGRCYYNTLSELTIAEITHVMRMAGMAYNLAPNGEYVICGNEDEIKAFVALLRK